MNVALQLYSANVLTYVRDILISRTRCANNFIHVISNVPSGQLYSPASCGSRCGYTASVHMLYSSTFGVLPVLDGKLLQSAALLVSVFKCEQVVHRIFGAPFDLCPIMSNCGKFCQTLRNVGIDCFRELLFFDFRLEGDFYI